MGRKVLLLLPVAAMMAACGLEEIGGGPESGNGVWFGPGNLVSGNGAGSGPGTSDGVGRKVWYAVGVDYPDGYDWREDTQKGSVKCSLVVFANGVPMMKVPVGDEYEVSADPDMHRMIGNSLYTDYSTAGETAIKKNGTQLFRYAGREMILDMVAEGDDVYTLGQDRDGGGFAFRKNGEILLERSNGYTFQRIQRCDAGWCFAFCETISSGKGEVERYFIYAGGTVSQVAVREDMKKVWDVMMCDGKICFVSSMVGVALPVLVSGEEMKMLGLPAGAEVESIRFVTGSGLVMEGIISQKGKDLFSGLWKESQLVKMFSPGYTVVSMCSSEDDICCVLNGPASANNGVIYRFGELSQIPSQYMSMGGRSMALVDGILYVGLTSESGNAAAVWVDNEMKPLKINGFISHISVN